MLLRIRFALFSDPVLKTELFRKLRFPLIFRRREKPHPSAADRKEPDISDKIDDNGNGDQIENTEKWKTSKHNSKRPAKAGMQSVSRKTTDAESEIHRTPGPKYL